jgi:RHS repeat-associated protein
MPYGNLSLVNAHRLVGDPIDAVTGASTEVVRDFRLMGPITLDWRRHHDSSRVGVRCALGWGHSHEYDCTLRFDADGMRYVGPLGLATPFLALTHDGATASNAGLTLRRLAAFHYHVSEPGRPVMEFVFTNPVQPAPLRALVSNAARVEFRYRSDGVLEGLTDSTGRSIRADSDASGRIVRLSFVDGEGQRVRDLVTYEYDGAGDLVRGMDAYRHAFSLAYDAAHRIVRRTDQRGYSFHFAFDAHGRCIRSAGEDGLYEVRLDYRPTELRTLVTQADGGVWEYRYSEAGLLLQMVDPYGGARTYRHNDLGNVVEELDPNGDVTRWLYDASGHFLGKRSSLGQVSTDSERPLRPDQRARRVGSNPAQWEYGDLLSPNRAEPDDAARPGEHVPHGAGHLIGHVLETNGDHRPGQAAAGTHREIRDELGTLLRHVAVDGRTRQWGYDEGGNTVRYRDFDGAQSQFDYVSWDLRSRRTDPIGRTLVRRYTASARLAEEQDPAGVRSAYVYDLKGRLAEFWYDSACLERYRYDAADNLTALLDADGQEVVAFEVGPKNLVAAWRLGSGETHRFTYTDDGQYAGASGDAGDVTFDYDEFANRTVDARNGRGVAHRFSGRGALVSSTILHRYTTRYRWRSASTLEICDPGGKTHVVRFLDERVVLRSMCSGLTEAARYDAAGRCHAKASASTRTRGRRAAWVRHFAYSGEGDLLTVRDTATGTTHYEYDAAHRLCSATAVGDAPRAFHYDLGNNLLKQPGLAGVSVSGGHRLLTANGDTFEYDSRGNVSVRSGAGGVTRYRYDSRNMLVACETPRGEWRATYDPLGRRVRTSLGSEWREFYWDGDRLAAELRHDGQLRVYVYADGFALTPLLWLDYDGPNADPASGRRHFVLSDHLGTPEYVENEAGDVVWRARLAPFGQALVASSARVEMPLRFPGHYYDAETGLHCNRFRYYSPELGRYLQPDPLGTWMGSNLYAYTANPLKEVDVRGDCPVAPDSTNGEGQDGATEVGKTSKGGPAKPDDPSAFPNLPRGGGNTNDHANRVAGVITSGKPAVRKNRSVTVIEHENGTVSVGLSGNDPKRAQQTKQVVDELNRQHPPEPGKPPTYRTSQDPDGTPRPVDATKLRDPGSRDNPSPLPGTCSEPHAAQAAGENPSPPKAYQTVHSGPDECPTDHQMPGRPTAGPGGAEQMQPCNTCQNNGDHYENTAQVPGSTPPPSSPPPSGGSGAPPGTTP